MIMLFAGLRRGEVLALEWHDIDLVHHQLLVYKSLVFHAENGNQGEIKSTKTMAGKRTVSITDILAKVLSEAFQQDHGVLVCPSAEGEYMTKQSYKRAWESYMHCLNIAAGGRDASRSRPKIQAIEEFTTHQLRHTYVTM